MMRSPFASIAAKFPLIIFEMNSLSYPGTAVAPGSSFIAS